MRVRVDADTMTVTMLPRIDRSEPELWQASVRGERHIRYPLLFGHCLDRWEPCEINVSDVSRESALIALQNKIAACA